MVFRCAPQGGLSQSRLAQGSRCGRGALLLDGFEGNKRDAALLSAAGFSPGNSKNRRAGRRETDGGRHGRGTETAVGEFPRFQGEGGRSHRPGRGALLQRRRAARFPLVCFWESAIGSAARESRQDSARGETRAEALEELWP